MLCKVSSQDSAAGSRRSTTEMDVQFLWGSVMPVWRVMFSVAVQHILNLHGHHWPTR